MYSSETTVSSIYYTSHQTNCPHELAFEPPIGRRVLTLCRSWDRHSRFAAAIVAPPFTTLRPPSLLLGHFGGTQSPQARVFMVCVVQAHTEQSLRLKARSPTARHTLLQGYTQRPAFKSHMFKMATIVSDHKLINSLHSTKMPHESIFR